MWSKDVARTALACTDAHSDGQQRVADSGRWGGGFWLGFALAWSPPSLSSRFSHPRALAPFLRRLRTHTPRLSCHLCLSVWSTPLPRFLCEALLNRWTLQDVVAEDCAARCGHEEFRGADEPTALAAYLQQIFCESSTARQCFANHARCSFLGPHRVWSSQVARAANASSESPG